METNTLIIIYILLLVTTIVLVAVKKTHWASIIGVALLPIYFIWVLLDAFRSSNAKKVERDPQNEITRNEVE
jgi:Ca2+/Na+ antiporter